MLKTPVVINYATKSKDFSFLVKEGLGVYHVYDFIGKYSIASKRAMPVEKAKSKEELELFLELLSVLGLQAKRISDTSIQYVDPEFEEYEDVDLPLYTQRTYGTFSYLNTNYIQKNVPTRETVKRAIEYKEKVKKKIEEASVLSNVESGIYCGDFVSFVYDTIYDVSEILEKEKYLVFHISKPYMTNRMYKTLIIDREKAMIEARNGILTIVVPKEVAGTVIGKGGKNCKAMSEELGLRALRVVTE